MDQLQPPPSVPHIVQVYQPSVSTTKIQNPQIIHISHPSLQPSQGKLKYDQTITADSLHMAPDQNQMQSQLVMPVTVQSQVLSSEISQPLQFTSHVILPQVPVFKQHVLMDSADYYGQYEAYIKEQCIVAKVDSTLSVVHNNIQSENKPTSIIKKESETLAKKRTRSLVPNPNAWACNVRKQKHQRGEAYISRRGKYVPERHVRNIKNCLTSCKYKCNERISDTDREHIFKAFYSLSANEKKHFLLNTTERNYVKHSRILDGDHKRKYSFKYFFLVRAVRYTVCKNFYLGTLAISQKPVYNVHLGKSEMNIPKPDGRGLSAFSTHSLPSELKERVRNHILSYKTVDSKPIKQFSRKKQYLDPTISIKQMYTNYLTECDKDNLASVKESMYRKIFKQEFNLHFKRIKTEQLCCKCKGPIKKK